MSTIVGAWACAVFLPKLGAWVQAVEARGVLTLVQVAGCYAALIASGLGHSISYLNLVRLSCRLYPSHFIIITLVLLLLQLFMQVGTTGAVSAGVMQALRAVGVAAVSSASFCSPSAPEQCFNWAKGSSAALILFGVLMYSSGKAQQLTTVVKRGVSV